MPSLVERRHCRERREHHESITMRYGMRRGIVRTIRNTGEVGEILDAREQNPHELDELKRIMRDRYPVRHLRDILERATDSRPVNVAQDLPGWHMRQDYR